MLFPYLLKQFVKDGTLRLETCGGKHYQFGSGPPYVTIRLHRRDLEWSLGLWPDLKIGEAYVNRMLTIEKGNLRDFLTILTSNYRHLEKRTFFRWLKHFNGTATLLRQYNPLNRAQKNAAFHYDLPNELYDLFLDADRQYSCAYFTDPGNSLDQAQSDKQIHIASKLLLDRPGLKVLDIGSGWGGLGLYLAGTHGANVTGVTLSVNQYRRSRENARARGLDKQCNFELHDYRQETGPYDRIVSVGMFEHVGRKNYDEFFAHLRDLLAGDGVCLLHTIFRMHGPWQTNAFIRKHIFPGGDLPALSEITDSAQKAGLYITDVEVLRAHYAHTLRHWSDRCAANRTEIISLCGEAFYRKWQFYLIGCEMSFRYQDIAVAQVQLSKNRDTVPQTRDYMIDWERKQTEEIRKDGAREQKSRDLVVILPPARRTEKEARVNRG